MAHQDGSASRLDDFGVQRITEEDRNYRGSRYAEVKGAVFANPYQSIWGAAGEPPLPQYKTHFRKRQLEHACVRTLDTFADLRWGEDGKGFRRLIHPNGVCLTGTWKITEANEFSGYFKKGSHGLVIARASTGRGISRGMLRTFSVVGKIYPTLDENHEDLIRPANFFMQDTLTGTPIEHVTDVVMTNVPTLRLLDNIPGIPTTLRLGLVFRDVDEESSVRQLYEIAELDAHPGEATNTPEFMRLTAAEDHPVIDEEDFRDEILAHIFDRGSPTPQRTLSFDISVANEGEKVGDLLTGQRHVVPRWQRIGRLTFDNGLASYNGDFVLHFHHPSWRRDRNDPNSVVRVDGKKT